MGQSFARPQASANTSGGIAAGSRSESSALQPSTRPSGNSRIKRFYIYHPTPRGVSHPQTPHFILLYFSVFVLYVEIDCVNTSNGERVAVSYLSQNDEVITLTVDFCYLKFKLVFYLLELAFCGKQRFALCAAWQTRFGRSCGR